MKNEEICPKCLGGSDVMVSNTDEKNHNTKGFKYKKCTLCKGKGIVNSELAEDYIFSLNEDNFEDFNDDW